MAYLRIGSMELTRISQYDLSFFSLKNTYTTAGGKTVIYPVKMNKPRISFTAEIQGDYIEYDENGTETVSGEYTGFMDIIKNPEFICEYTIPGTGRFETETFTVTSDISIVKIMSDEGFKGGLYAVSLTIEGV